MDEQKLMEKYAEYFCWDFRNSGEWFTAQGKGANLGYF